MAFPDSFLQELADRNEITDVVSGYVRLTKRSGSNQFGLCPFHSERTPSFSVSPDKQIFHCFGCGKGGSVIGFIMEIENLSYPDAVYFLANRAGLAVPEDRPDETRRVRERMLELNRAAAKFFYSQLMASSGMVAQNYVNQRGISAAMVKSFGLGFAPDSWDSLRSAMLAQGFSESELFSAGLIKHGKKGGYYDTFRNRLMFPVIDVRGSVIGFSGRILGDGEPKYLNSPETLVFNKSRNLFALNLAKKSKSGYIILTEGNIDVVALHQAGFDSAVASLGTSLTAEQARLMSRYTGQVVIAYDNDDAGKKASQRAIGLLEKLDLTVRVLRMQDAKDPDEYIKLKGAGAFRSLLEHSENHIEYRLQTVEGNYDLSGDESKVEYLKAAADMLSQLASPVEREVYAMRVAEKAGVSSAVVEAEISRIRRRRTAQAKKKQEKSATRPSAAAQPAVKGIKYDNVRSAAAEEGIIRLLYLDPQLFSTIPPPSSEDFSSDALGRIYGKLLEWAREGRAVSIAALGESLSQEELAHLTGIIQKPEMLQNAKRALDDYIEILSEEKQNSAGLGDLRAMAEKYRGTKGYGA